MKTTGAREHELWNQITNKEIKAKKRFEFITGETQADKYFGGDNKPFVDSLLKTHSNWRRNSENNQPTLIP